MKKTLAAVAVLGAFAGSALAADVQLYGIVDTGLRYTHFDADSAAAGYDATDSFGIQSGNQSGSRFGFKGTEDLGNGLTVGFILETQFNSDDGSLTDDDHFFRRESSLFLQGGFGKVAFGRMGSINGGTSSWGKYGVISAFGTSWGNYAAQAGTFAIGGGQWDNMISYETPSFAGFKVFAQYGMGNTVSEDETVTVTGPDGNYDVTVEHVYGTENESDSDRYYAIGASYANGPLNLYFAVDSTNYSSVHYTGVPYDQDDSLTVTLGGNYDFEVVKLFAGAQYFDEVKLTKMKGAVNYSAAANQGLASRMKGFGVGLSASIPVAGGNVLVGAAYLDAEAADSVGTPKENDELTRWIVSAGYDYPFSKRTDVYGVLTYNQDSLDYTAPATKDNDPTVFGVMIGLRHKF